LEKIKQSRNPRKSKSRLLDLPNLDAKNVKVDRKLRIALIRSPELSSSLKASPMGRGLAKISKVKLPTELAKLFGDPPLVGNEAREDYNKFFEAIADAVNPADAIAWLYVRDITDLSWEIKRERNLKRLVLAHAYRGKVRACLTPQLPRTGILTGILQVWGEQEVDAETERSRSEVNKKVDQWDSDPRARRRIDNELAEQGYDAEYILREALNDVADLIDAIDRRIASYELRRMAALRATEHYSETLAQRLRDASSRVIDTQFTQAAE
jgi:hypothetical protein